MMLHLRYWCQQHIGWFCMLYVVPFHPLLLFRQYSAARGHTVAEQRLQQLLMQLAVQHALRICTGCKRQMSWR